MFWHSCVFAGRRPSFSNALESSESSLEQGTRQRKQGCSQSRTQIYSTYRPKYYGLYTCHLHKSKPNNLYQHPPTRHQRCDLNKVGFPQRANSRPNIGFFALSVYINAENATFFPHMFRGHRPSVVHRRRCGASGRWTWSPWMTGRRSPRASDRRKRKP